MSPQARPRRGLATWLASTATPLFVVDPRRRIVFFNAGCVHLTGWSAAEVLGQTCDFVSQPDHTQLEALTGVLCPPPQAFEGRAQTVSALVVTRNGDRLPRLIHFLPLPDTELPSARVLGAITPRPETPVAEREPPDQQRHAELAALRAELWQRYQMSNVVGASAAFRRTLQQLEMARRHNGSVHLQGESGTGKEHLARVLHMQSAQRRKVFVPLDAARLTRSELTDAVRRVFRDAHDPEVTILAPGTLYLSHVDRLPDTVQEMLLREWSDSLEHSLDVRVEETGARTGGEAAAGNSAGAERGPRVRLLSSSERGLEEAVRDDRLSVELYQLLTTQQICVPPLRERADDLQWLAQYFLESLNRDQEHQVSELSHDVWTAFRRYVWPGNLDELREVVTAARAATEQHTIHLNNLPFRFRTGVEAQA
ncbi:MAG: sigma 54-interacting transcriptional regulator, partial [Planctomycetaceae bacterium]|nr:sigma 54-interacting transcriptional regulator [Planctomycetaceae bacterium]